MNNLARMIPFVWLLVIAPSIGHTQPKAKPKFTVGRKTTFVDGPLTKTGHIDYVTALNRRLSKGVTPANNANVLLWRAMGPHPERVTMPPEYFKWLGIKAPPKKGDYFVDLDAFLRREMKKKSPDEIQDIVEKSYQIVARPWSAKKHPLLAKWLTTNKTPLALVVEASKRSHYYNPLIPSKFKGHDSQLIGALLPNVQLARHFAAALQARAMLRVAQGKHEAAWQDLLAMQRLARRVGSGGTLIEGLVGVAIISMTNRAQLQFLAAAKLTSKQIKSKLQDIQRLPTLSPVADNVDVTERIVILETIMFIDRGGLSYLDSLAGRKGARIPPKRPLTGKVNWDPALKNINHWFDRSVVALRAKDRRLRRKKMVQITNGLRKLKSEIPTNPLMRLFMTPKSRVTMIGNVIVSLLLPAFQKVQEASDRIEQEDRNVRVAFALAAYRNDHGRYPKSLKSLAPMYLKTVPHDMFSGKLLIYQPKRNGYVLYSFGPNERDDQGRGYDDAPYGDDLVVRMPPRKLRNDK